MIVAITRPTGPELAACQLTHIGREPIDIDLAHAQHEEYLGALRSAGAHVVELPRLPDYPDAVFVEDTALVLPEIAVLLRPGAESRRGEVPSMAETLADYRELLWMEAPATVDGGDIIVLGKKVLIGRTARSNPAGAEALAEALAPFGYVVEPVEVRSVLHLKSAATAVDDETLIVYPAHVDLTDIGAQVLEAHPAEPQGANVVRVGETLLMDASAPRTIATVAEYVGSVAPVDVSEFAKAEGAVSCKSVVFDA